MLLYSTRTAVFKNGDKSVLLCRITLPTDAEDGALCSAVAELYGKIYVATYSFAKAYAARILPPDGRLALLEVKCEHELKKGCLTVKRTYTISHSGKVIKERVFKDKFREKCDKTKKYSIKER